MTIRTIRTIIAGVLIACTATAPAAAAQADSAPLAAPSADHLAIATRLMDVMMPPAQREAMVLAMVDMTLQNVSTGILNNDRIKTALDADPAARRVFEQFVDRQRALTQQSMRTNLPSMIDAMAIAYARQFSAAEMVEMERFFATPVGQAYVSKSSTIMSDPAVAAWQQRVIAADMQRLPAEMARFAAAMADLEGKGNGDGS